MDTITLKVKTTKPTQEIELRNKKFETYPI